MKNDSNKFIIGAGITGLVWKYYHPEFQVISPDVGGMYAKSHLVWLHHTYETEKLLRDLGFPIKKKRSRIGYYNDGWITDSLSTDMNLKMIQKKMTSWDQPLDESFVPKTNDLSLSSGALMGTNYMNTLDVDLEAVISKLNENADVKHGFVTQITPDHIEVKKDFKDPEGEILPYEKLVTTIAAPLFWRAWGTPKEFKCLPITNVIVKNQPSVFDDRYEMIYYDDSQHFSRASYLQGHWALEFTGLMTREKFEELYPDLEIVDIFTTPQGRIFENTENVPPTDKIIFSGRFSQWKYGTTSEHVISQSINYNG